MGVLNQAQKPILFSIDAIADIFGQTVKWLRSFDSNSVSKGLKVIDKCWCGREGKYPNPCFDDIPVKLVCKKHSTPETFRKWNNFGEKVD